MTEAELKSLYDEGKKIIRDERKWRRIVFANKPKLRDAKVAEMDRLMAILVQMKDALKPHVEIAYEQPTLLDVPRKSEYR